MCVCLGLVVAELVSDLPLVTTVVTSFAEETVCGGPEAGEVFFGDVATVEVAFVDTYGVV